jgi:hypothetical protein
MSPQAPSRAPDVENDANHVQRIALATGALVASVNVWTGAPLFAVWVGSRVQGTSGVKMGPLFVVVGVLIVLELVLVYALGWINGRYDHITGRDKLVRRPPPWRSSLSAEREDVVRREEGVNAIERVVSISVAAGLAAFQIWFFFFSGSSLPAA